MDKFKCSSRMDAFTLKLSSGCEHSDSNDAFHSCVCHKSNLQLDYNEAIDKTVKHSTCSRREPSDNTFTSSDSTDFLLRANATSEQNVCKRSKHQQRRWVRYRAIAEYLHHVNVRFIERTATNFIEDL